MSFPVELQPLEKKQMEIAEWPEKEENEKAPASLSLSPGLRNPNKMETLRPGQGAEGRKKYTRSLASQVRNYLESAKKRAVDKEGRNRLQQVLENLFRIAASEEHPHAVAAAQVLLDRAYGKPKPSEEELDAIKGSGFQLVYVQRPEIDPDIPQQQELPAPKPDFLDAEIVAGEQH
jgi:hypothetical protein